MIYEHLGEDTEDLTPRHAVMQGTHDAIADAIKYTALGTIAITAASLFLGRKRTREIARRILGGG